jgi:hypothetical protein
MLRALAAAGLMLIAVACSAAGESVSERVRSVHPHEVRAPAQPTAAPSTPSPSPSPPPSLERSGWLAQFPGCDSPVSACFCDDRVLELPHRELRLGPTPKPVDSFLAIAHIDLHPLQLSYFGQLQLDLPGYCLSGPCPTKSAMRVELVGPGAQTSNRYGTWSCQGGPCDGPVETWRGSLHSNAWLDIQPEHEALRLFVHDQLVYSVTRPKLPMNARVVLLSEPEYTLAFSFGDGEPDGAFMVVNVQTPLVKLLPSSLRVQRRPQGCWTLIELGDLPFVDPVSVRLSDPFRTAIYQLSAQDGVPPRKQSAKATPGPHAKLARHKFDHRQTLRAADLSFADLRKARFDGANAQRARFHKARLQQAYSTHSDFVGADFSAADLRGAYLIRSKLRDTTFSGADLAHARLDRSDLSGANLAHARNLTQAQLDSACGDPDTKLPSGLSISTCWEPWMSLRTNAITDPAASELLVATRARDCSGAACSESCCDSCRRIEWKPSSNANMPIVADGIRLPDHVPNMCGLHFDLRAEGKRADDRMLVRSVQPVPSERLRRAGTPGQLELEAIYGNCTMMGCSDDNPCCNSCSFGGWGPKPTRDVVKWSGVALPYADPTGCDSFDLAVTGTWLGPSEFQVSSVRKLK